jgi:hypothetical protein
VFPARRRAGSDDRGAESGVFRFENLEIWQRAADLDLPLFELADCRSAALTSALRPPTSALSFVHNDSATFRLRLDAPSTANCLHPLSWVVFPLYHWYATTEEPNWRDWRYTDVPVRDRSPIPGTVAGLSPKGTECAPAEVESRRSEVGGQTAGIFSEAACQPSYFAS